MEEKHILGKKGETIAKEHLLENSYSILEENWRYLKAEIDLIAQKDDFIVFVEVKTRTYATFGQPEEAISVKKQQLMYELASEYMFREQYEEEYRFDIISIVLQPSREINHYEDAFFPHW